MSETIIPKKVVKTHTADVLSKAITKRVNKKLKEELDDLRTIITTLPLLRSLIMKFPTEGGIEEAMLSIPMVPESSIVPDLETVQGNSWTYREYSNVERLIEERRQKLIEEECEKLLGG